MAEILLHALLPLNERRGPALRYWEVARPLSHQHLRQGDFCPSDSLRQQGSWLGGLAARGWPSDHTRDSGSAWRLIDILSLGPPAKPAEPAELVLTGRLPGIRPHDRVMWWCRGLPNRLDPLQDLKAMQLRTESGCGHAQEILP